MKNMIKLRAFELYDLDTINSVRNDDESFSKTGGNKFYISKEWDRKWIEDKIFNNQNQIYLAVCFKESIIGYLGMINIDFRNRKAEWAGINIHRDYIGKGYGSEAAELMIRFAFEELNLNKLYGYWLVSNMSSLRMAEKLGFVQEGIIKDFVFKRNEYHTAKLLSLSRSDYINKFALKNE